MSNLQKTGGYSAIAFAILLVIGLILIIPPFTTMSPDAADPANFAARLAFAAALSQMQRLTLAVGFALEVGAPVAIFPAVLALYLRATSQQKEQALLAGGLMTLAIPFFITEHLPRFSLLILSADFSRLSAIDQAGRAGAYAYAEGLSINAEIVFWLFFTCAAIAYLPIMRGSGFGRWLPWLGVFTGAIGLITNVGTYFAAALGAASVLALLLLIVVFFGLGVSLVRAKGSQP